MSLDNEDEQNCTEITSGMHRRLPEWLNRIHSRGLDLNKAVSRITKDLYFPEDAAQER